MTYEATNHVDFFVYKNHIGYTTVLNYMDKKFVEEFSNFWAWPYAIRNHLNLIEETNAKYKFAESRNEFWWLLGYDIPYGEFGS